MRKAYFHIGFGKTGTSSLQSYLSFNPLFEHPVTNEKLVYCCILKDGKIIFGEDIKKRARRNIFKYCASSPSVTNPEYLDVLKRALDKVYALGFTPIFSQEDWGLRSANFDDACFFTKLDIEATVIVYVRPQVEWLNSAWWQWFAWDKSFKVPQDVIGAWGCNVMSWGSHILQWRRIEGIKDVVVRLQPEDIVEDFMGLFKINPVLGTNQKFRVNTSLPLVFIKLLIKYPFLRSTQGAYVDTILSRIFKVEGKSPWIITTELAQQIITATRLDNEKLLGMLDETSQVKMKIDTRWWDAEYYKNHSVCGEKDLELGKGELFSIIAQAIRR